MWNRLKYILSPQFDIYEVLGKVVNGNVADIGCGTGFGTHLLTARADKVYGYEIDKNAIKFAERVFPFDKLFFSYGDITKGIFGEYDFVIMVDVLEHIKNDKKALENVRGMLTKGGKLILSTPNRLSRYRKADTHYREYSPDELKTLLQGVFNSVELRNHALEPLSSQYENPLLAICRGE